MGGEEQRARDLVLRRLFLPDQLLPDFRRLARVIAGLDHEIESQPVGLALVIPANGAMSDKPGRDHNSYGLVMWMAGGDVKGGSTAGETDEFGLRSTGEPIPIRNVHATILDLVGLDDDKLRYLHAGRFRQLTDIGGEVLTDIIS